MTKNDLAPCPFCGSTDFDLAHKPDPRPPSYPGGVWVIECGGCGALGPFCEERENAPKAWNDCKRRPAAEPKAGRPCNCPDGICTEKLDGPLTMGVYCRAENRS